MLQRLEQQEAEKFRQLVQGGGERGRGGAHDDSDSDDEVGPAPLVQPEEYQDEKKVSEVGV
jgi:hypothetical protein